MANACVEEWYRVRGECERDVSAVAARRRVQLPAHSRQRRTSRSPAAFLHRRFQLPRSVSLSYTLAANNEATNHLHGTASHSWTIKPKYLTFN